MADYEQLLVCPICMDEFKDPKILSCHHSFCRECLNLVPQEREEGRCLINCPVCRLPTQLTAVGISGLSHSFFIHNLLEIYHQSQPSRREEPEPWSCPTHQQPLDMYCEDCKKLVCGHCMKRDHRAHDIQFVANCFEENVVEINHALESVKQNLGALETALNLLEDMDESFIRESSEVEHSINAFANDIVYKINRFRDELTNQVKSATQKKRNVLQQQKRAIVDILMQIQGSYSSVDKVLGLGCQRKILSSKKQMLYQLKMAREVFDVTLLKPVESFDVQFKPNLADPLKGLGTVTASHVHQKFVAKGDALKFAHCLSHVAFDIEVNMNEEMAGVLPVSMVAVEMVPYTTIEVSRCETSPNKFTVKYMAISQRPHMLCVKIGGENIRDSPFTVQLLHTNLQRVDVPLSKIVILSPRGLCVTSRGSVIVAEYPKDIINEQIKIQTSAQGNPMENEHFSVLKNDGTKKNIECPFPAGIAATNDDHILVVDKRNAYVRKYKVNCGEVARGTIGVGRFRYLNGIAINREGMIAVTEVNSASIHVFNPDLTYKTEIGGDYRTPFFHPTGIAFDSQGNVYVCDCGYSLIFKLDSEYKILSKFGNTGCRYERLNQPMAIAVDHNDLVYVADTYNDRIAVFDTIGRFLTCFGNRGDQVDRLCKPCGVVVGQTGKVFVSDTGNDRVVVFN